MPPKARPIEERFHEKVDRRGPDECWPWTGTTRSDGYGVLGRGFKQTAIRAHRLAFQLANGHEAHGDVCHSCDNPPCCNPAHLFDGSHRENMLDAWDKSRLRGDPRRNADASHCVNGHEFTPENTYLRPDRPGTRECRACRVERVTAWRSANPERTREWGRAAWQRANANRLREPGRERR